MIGKLRKELDVGSDNRGAELKRKQDDLASKLADTKNRLEKAKSEIETFKREHERLSQQLLDTKEVAGKQRERRQVESDIHNMENSIVADRDRIIESFNRNYFSFFAAPILMRALDVLSSAKDDPQGIPMMHSKSIDYILKRKRCICGCDLSKNQGAVENILYEQKLLPPQHIGSDINTCKTQALQYCEQAKGVAQTILADYREISRISLRIEQQQDKLKQLSEEIKKLGEVNVKKIEEDYQANENLLSSKQRLQGRLEGEISSIEKQLQDCARDLGGLALKSEKNSLIKLEMQYGKAVYDWFKASYDQLETEVREQLTESINRIFKEMYHGTRSVELDNNYRIKLKTDVDGHAITTDESKGLEAVKNFSFISGLVDLARKKARQPSSNDVTLSTEPYPIVMDAPFSNVDEIHISNIATILPQTAEQVILIVMKKDWEFARAKMIDKVGASYVIEKVNNSETHSVIRSNENV